MVAAALRKHVQDSINRRRKGDRKPAAEEGHQGESAHSGAAAADEEYEGMKRSRSSQNHDLEGEERSAGIIERQGRSND